MDERDVFRRNSNDEVSKWQSVSKIADTMVGDPWTEALSRKHSVANAVSLTYERGTVRHMRPTDWKLWYPMVW